jgi:diketogulonate reductase-like aldo/keto reductase
LAWTLLNPTVTSTILGVRTLEQLQDNLGALDVTFSEDQIARLDAVSRVEMGFPHTMLSSPMLSTMFGGVNVATRRA